MSLPTTTAMDPDPEGAADVTVRATAALFGVAVLLAALLVLASARSWVDLRAAHGAVVRGATAEAVVAARQVLPPDDRMPTAEELAAGLVSLRPLGVVWVAVVIRGQGVVLEAGEHAVEGGELPGSTQTLVEVDGVARVFVPPRRPPTTRGGPPPPALVIEMHSNLAADLLRGATRQLAVSCVAGLLLTASAWWWLRRTQQAARGAARMARRRHLAALGEMSAVMAHELRNPLAAAKGHAQLLMEAAPPGKLADRAARVAHELARLEGLTNSLLRFVREGGLQHEVCDPLDVVRQAMADCPGGGGRLLLRAPAAVAPWRVDPARLQEALVNVLHNAIVVSEAAVEVGVVEHPDRVEICVRDRGPGIPPERAHDLFEPFVTTRAQGTGLGLAVARRNVELHGGTLTARNHPDGGAEMLFRVPKGA